MWQHFSKEVRLRPPLEPSSRILIAMLQSNSLTGPNLKIIFQLPEIFRILNPTFHTHHHFLKTTFF